MIVFRWVTNEHMGWWSVEQVSFGQTYLDEDTAIDQEIGGFPGLLNSLQYEHPFYDLELMVQEDEL